jgi:hypothetical protein
MKRVMEGGWMLRFSLGALMAATAAVLSPQAAAAADIVANFNVDVGPMTMTVVRYELDTSGDTVHAKARIKSNGISSMFAEYSVQAEAEARTGGGVVQPERFRLVRERDDNRREASLSWSDQGEISYAPAIKKPDLRQKVERALDKDVVDPMTVILRLGASGSDPCPSVHQVFDGRDVFELAFTDKGRGKAADPAAYRGEVQHCEVRWTPLAGRAMEKKVPGDVYDVSFAPVGKLASGQTVWLPVFMTGKLKGLRFSAYVTKLKAAGISEASAQ